MLVSDELKIFCNTTHKGTMVPEETLNRILFATRYTHHLDRNGYIRFQDWRLYGERGLAQQPVTVWVYEGTLKLEYQAVTLSKYRVELLDDWKHIKGVSNPRIAETVFRSPQLTSSTSDQINGCCTGERRPMRPAGVKPSQR